MKALKFKSQTSAVLSLMWILTSYAYSMIGPMAQDEIVIFDFKNSDTVEDWIIINDGVMGGLSQSEILMSDSSTAVFRGTVSLENNGGFSLTRSHGREYALENYNGILFRLKGDGKKYQFRIRTDNRFDGISYRYQFETKIDQWITIKVPFKECVPVFRGRILNDVEPISPKMIQQIGFMIADYQAGQFQLEIEWIKAYK